MENTTARDKDVGLVTHMYKIKNMAFITKITLTVQCAKINVTMIVFVGLLSAEVIAHAFGGKWTNAQIKIPRDFLLIVQISIIMDIHVIKMNNIKR